MTGHAFQVLIEDDQLRASLSSFLSGAGLAIEAQFGDWDRQPLTDTSPEIITIVRRG